MSATFGARLQDLAKQRGRLCVGIDPHPGLLEGWGLPQTVAGLKEFTQICVDVFGPTVALVKPQVAFYEAYGAQGYAVLEAAIGQLREQGALVLADAKRGDIGSTMAAYAAAWLQAGSPLEVDAVTVSPYLGFGALQPALDFAPEKGVFVLAATSNPEGATIQQGRSAVQDATIAQYIVDCAGVENQTAIAAGATTGSVGVVIGATLSDIPNLTNLHGPVLLPGVGAQGAGPSDVKRLMQHAPELGFANVSRGVLKAGPNPEALHQAVQDLVAQFGR